MTIRSATAQDVPAVLAMMAEQAKIHEAWDPAKYGYRLNAMEMYARWLPGRVTDARSVFLVAEREDKLVGFIVATTEKEIPIYRVDEFGFIHDVWVDPAYRHEGVARQMVMLTIERFKTLGVPQVRLDTVAQNDAARSLFTACGFRTSMIEMLLELKKV